MPVRIVSRMTEPTSEWAELWAAFEAGELGWKVERVSHGEDKGTIVWIARRVTPADVERWPELRVGRWILLEIEGSTVHATQWPVEPGRLGPKLERDEDEDVNIPW